jgi:Ca2+-binding EF-hand superfamily protein
MKLAATLAATTLLTVAGAAQAAPAAAKATVKATAKAAVKASTVAFARADKDDDDLLSLDEFESFLKPLGRERGGKGKFGKNAQLLADLEQASATLFAWFDADASGGVSLDEWLAGRASDPTVSAPDFTLIPFGAIDRNGDGKLNFGEFQGVFAGYAPTLLSKAWFQLYLDAQVTVTVTAS